MRTNTKATITPITPPMIGAGDVEFPPLETKSYKKAF